MHIFLVLETEGTDKSELFLFFIFLEQNILFLGYKHRYTQHFKFHIHEAVPFPGSGASILPP